MPTPMLMCLDSSRLVSAVRSLCPDIQDRIAVNGWQRRTEEELWEEMVFCILSSQVSYECAHAATQHLRLAGLLVPDDRLEGRETYERQLADRLRQPIEISHSAVNGRRYRFPDVRARQISRTWSTIYGEGQTLRVILMSSTDGAVVREQIIDNATGIGPKQASMFLRNIGFSLDLAVLDRHVMHYMDLVGIPGSAKIPPARLQRYGEVEVSLRSHADMIGHPIGCVDWAIWIVMRVVRDMRHP